MSRNRVHPSAVIGPDVELGDGNVIGPYSVILGPSFIGSDNWIGPHVAIGTPGEMRGAHHAVAWEGEIVGDGTWIGDGNVIREFATVQAPIAGRTVIGDGCYVMTKAHLPHDGVLGDSVTISCSVMIGGHSRVGSHANLGLGSVVHQRLVIGPGAMVGMGSVVTKPVPPYATAFGNPARVRSGNTVGLQRGGFPEETIAAVDRAYRSGETPVDVPELDAVFAWYESALADV